MRTATLKWGIALAPPTRAAAAAIVRAEDDRIAELRALGADEEADRLTRARDEYARAATRYYDALERGKGASAP
jgi:hypothetical protein